MLSVTEKGQPVCDNIKLQRLKQILMDQIDDNQEGMVNIKKVGFWILLLCQSSGPCWIKILQKLFSYATVAWVPLLQWLLLLLFWSA